jgi:hypothetical protein
MEKKTIILVLTVLVIVGIHLSAIKYAYDQSRVLDKPLQYFMTYIAENHPDCFDDRYASLSNWELVAGHYETINGLHAASMGIVSNPNANNYIGYLEANTSCGLFTWNGVLWISNNSVSEIIYSITG